MGIQLSLYHKNGAGNPNLPLPKGFWHLATCLRSVVISESSSRPQSLADYEVYQGAKAYEFFLQVICGLQSPLMGETEILGQFKSFVNHNKKQFSPNMVEIIDRWLKDAKDIRATYLQNLGCTSYGSLIRKFLRDSQQDVTIVGAGSLAQDILPWLNKDNRQLEIFTRHPEKYQSVYGELEKVSLKSYKELQQDSQSGGILIIAAPLQSHFIKDNFNLASYQAVFDLRGESENDPIEHKNLTSLGRLFSSIESNKKNAIRVREKALVAVAEHTQSLLTLEKQRPFGWDDLWAYA